MSDAYDQGAAARRASKYNAGLNTSHCHTWETPPELFAKLNAEFGFTLDVCALPENAKCQQYYTPEQDGLSQTWRGVCWMNPPYGRAIGLWVKKAYESAKLHGATVVCLVPSRTCSAWWHDYAMKGEVRFLRGRVKFVGGKNTAPFPSAVVVFNGNTPGQRARGNRTQDIEKERE